MKQAMEAALPLLAVSWLVAVADASKLRAGDSVADNATEPSCKLFVCEDGWFPKANHLSLKGNSAAECCVKTCKLWNCSHGYKAHADFADNVGNSNAECCDKTCLLFNCDETWAVPKQREDQAGVTHDACCMKTCAALASGACVGDVAPDPEKTFVVPDDPQECCVDSCAVIDCDASEGLVHDIAKQTDRAPSSNPTDYCCDRTCAYYSGKCHAHHFLDTGNAAAMAQTVTDDTFESKCCREKCHSGLCQKDYDLDPTYQDYFVDEAPYGCCIPTCKAHDCPNGWEPMSSAESFSAASLRDEDCCEKTCALHSCGPGWFNSSNKTKLDEVANSDQICCEPSCNHHNCPQGLSLRPSADEIEDLSDTSCCEPERCVEMRDNRTNVAGDEHCNEMTDKAACGHHYDLYLTDKLPSGFVVVPCYWNESLTLCRMHDESVLTTCDPMD